MRLWYGRWVTSYKHNDEVYFIDEDETQLLVGNIQLPCGHFTGEWYVISNESYYKDSIQLMCPFNNWYEEHKESIFKAFKEHQEKQNEL